MNCKPWEVWLAKVRFEDSDETKNRPVLIIVVDSKYYRVKMTGTSPRDFFEVEVSQWKAAGLRKDTTIRTNKISELRESDLIHKLGDLHPVDIAEFRQKFSRLHRC